MIKNRLLLKAFSSGMQAVAVQILGSVFFYFLSIYLSKDSFGVIGWMNALCLFITTLLGLGLEQVVVRRIAVSKTSDWAATAFLAHSVIGALITFIALIAFSTFINTRGVYQYLPWFFAAQGLVYMGTPLKQFLNAKERFTPYGIIAMISNASKTIAACLLLHNSILNIHTVVIILICSAAFELGCLFIYIITQTTFSFKLHFKPYAKLLKESSAQYISVIFDMSLSRIDWILLGILSTNIVLADYSFAYRAFELARLPILIIAPLILPRLSRSMANKAHSIGYKQQINSLNTVELFLGVMIPLVMNILWTPVVGFITKGKYGDANALPFLILSLCIPLQLFINLLWSISFSSKKYRQVSTITMICAVTNLLLNLILIPRLGGLGAAIAFLITTLTQCGLYYNLVNKQIMGLSLKPAMLFITLAIVVYLIVTHIYIHFLIQLLIAVGLYVGIAMLLRQINSRHFYNAKLFLSQ